MDANRVDDDSLGMARLVLNGSDFQESCHLTSVPGVLLKSYRGREGKTWVCFV